MENLASAKLTKQNLFYFIDLSKFVKNGEESILPLPPKLKKFFLPQYKHMQSKNQVAILGVSIFEKPEQTIQLNLSADRVRKKRLPPSYFALLPGLQNLLQCSGWVLSKNGVDLVEVSIFY